MCFSYDNKNTGGQVVHLIQDLIQARAFAAVLPFLPKYDFGQPDNYFMLLSKYIFIGSKYLKINVFKFLKKTSLACREAPV